MVTVVECWIAPLVPVTVTTTVWGALPIPANPPLQPTNKMGAASKVSATSAAVRGRANCLASFFRCTKIAAMPKVAMANGMSGVGCGGIGSEFELAVAVPAKVMVMTVVAPVDPGVTTGGLKVAVAPAGNPEADMVTWLLKELPIGGTLIVTLTELPRAAEIGAGGAVTLNCGASVTVKADEVEPADAELPE
jgi:hypothetical protein